MIFNIMRIPAVLQVTTAKTVIKESHALREKCPYWELFWSAFSHIRTKNIDQNNSEHGHFLHSDKVK